jgi:hypothetical protein
MNTILKTIPSGMYNIKTDLKEYMLNYIIIANNNLIKLYKNNKEYIIEGPYNNNISVPRLNIYDYEFITIK